MCKKPLLDKIAREYDNISKDALKNLPPAPQERAKIFESLCDFIYEFYKAGREYAKRNSNKNT